MGTIGLIANPASGKDVRRLVARASVFDNQEKRAIIRRALAGIRAAGDDCRLVYLDDPHGIVRQALEEASCEAVATAVAVNNTGSALDTTSAAKQMKALGCSVVLTLGGDGTNRAVVRGWQDVPTVPVSTGTNNVFPRLVEATVAGAACGLLASGRIRLADIARRHKLIHVAIDDEADDVALIDAVLSRERFVGSRALLDAGQLHTVLLTRADPAGIGMTSLGGLMHPLEDRNDGGLLVSVGAEGAEWNVPIAPGHYRTVPVTGCRTVAFGESVSVEGPGVLAFDGERERVLARGQRARFSIERDGPWVVDVSRALSLAAEAQAFRI